MSRAVRVALTLVVTGLGVAHILSQIDVSETVDTIVGAHAGYLLGAFAITLVTTVPMAWRWQRLLAAKGIHDRLAWLVRAYLVAYSAGQILPTTVGGDAVRIYETTRRHSGRGGTIAGSVLLERALGATATLLLAAVGFALAVGRYDVTAYIWLEAALVVGTAVVGTLLFARSARPLLARARPLLRFLRLERPVRAGYEGIHAYRANVRLLLGVLALTLVVQAVRIFAIWMTGKSVDVDVSPRAYFVMGPLLFLIMLIPFTINGLAVREAFFVSFLTGIGVDADPAFATGFLFFVVTIGLALPGVAIVGWESLRGKPRASIRPGRG
jgi:glycosyltransferase 2 family protein